MDPVSFLIGALVLTAMAKVGISATSDAYATVKAAQSGAWEVVDRQRDRWASFWQRLGAAWAARRRARHVAAGGDGEFRPGAREYVADLYHGFWEDRLERRAARRANRGPYVFDPDRLSWGQRFDAAVMRKVATLRERWGQRVPEPVEVTPLDELLDHDEPVPVVHDPGTWTVDDQGQRVELAPAEAQAVIEPANAWNDDPKYRPMQTIPAGLERPCPRKGCGGTMRPVAGTDHFDADGSASIATACDRDCGMQSGADWYWPVGDPPAEDPDYGDDEQDTESTDQGGTPMTTTTTTAATVEEVQDNEAARRNFKAQQEAAGEGLEALAAYEAAIARLAGAANASADGMAATRFDAGATGAQANIADLIPATSIAAAAGALEEMKVHAEQGLRSLDKYRDAEDLVVSENVDAKTLEPTSA